MSLIMFPRHVRTLRAATLVLSLAGVLLPLPPAEMAARRTSRRPWPSRSRARASRWRSRCPSRSRRAWWREPPRRVRPIRPPRTSPRGPTSSSRCPRVRASRPRPSSRRGRRHGGRAAEGLRRDCRQGVHVRCGGPEDRQAEGRVQERGTGAASRCRGAHTAGQEPRGREEVRERGGRRRSVRYPADRRERRIHYGRHRRRVEQVTDIELKQPGKYALICFIQDRKGGPPHVMKGMIKEVEVQ